MYFLVVIRSFKSLNRLISIVVPLKYHIVFSNRNTIKMLTCAIVYQLIIAAIFYIFQNEILFKGCNDFYDFISSEGACPNRRRGIP